MTEIVLPDAEGALVPYRLVGAPLPFVRHRAGAFPRVAYAAAHVVADPLAAVDPWVEAAIDWDATLAFRHRLWDLGLGVAEAMDTAQRGMGLDWPAAQELIRRTQAEARGRDDALVAHGAGTDHLAAGPEVSIADIIGAYETQMGFVEGEGGRVILMASRALAAAARSPGDCEGLRACAGGRAAAGDPALAGRRCSTRRWPATGARACMRRRWRCASR